MRQIIPFFLFGFYGLILLCFSPEKATAQPVRGQLLQAELPPELTEYVSTNGLELVTTLPSDLLGYVELRFHYLDDEDGDYCRYSHNFNYNNSAKANSFREFAFNNLIERFGSEYGENNNVNCSNYYWKYTANLLYTCKSDPNSVSICSP
jgi:hypothetical protein